MRPVEATIYALKLPFVEGFQHSTQARNWSDSVVIRVVDEAGNEGFGEGAPRPYVTGETPDGMVRHLAEVLWPAVADRELPIITGLTDLDTIQAMLPDQAMAGVLAPNAARAAMELALLDLATRGRGTSLATALPRTRDKVAYSGVVTASSPEKAAQHARQMKLVGLTQLKIKVGLGDDEARVRAIREVMGPDASLRLDANGVWDLDTAVAMLETLAVYGIDSVEEPLPRGPLGALRALRGRTRVPVVVDESLVTLDDARALIAAEAADIFNVRVSKCGGIAPALAIARLAHEAGLRVQVGAQVGETAILSAAGRHLACAVDDLLYAEGSYGTLLLTEDVSADPVRFGHRGLAPALNGPGLGVRFLEPRLRKWAATVMALPRAGVSP